MILRNYYSLCTYGQTGQAVCVVDPDGNDQLSTYSTPNVKTAMQKMQMGYTSGYGVILGKGDAIEDYYDYKLSGGMITGYTYSMTISSGRDDKGNYVKGKYTITNNNSSAFTVKEVGLLYYWSGSDSYQCLIDRTVLDTPITINSGGVGQLEYTIRVNNPAKEFPLDYNQPGVHGVSWYFGSSSSNLTRLGDSAKWGRPSPATDLDAVGTSPFDEVMPWAGMKRYNIIDGIISFSEEDESFSETSYDTMVYIPPFYYSVQEDRYLQKIQWAISAEPREGFTLHPGSGRYVGRFHTANVSSVYSSKSGYTPVYSITRATARSNSHAKGSNWWQMDIATWSAIQLLYLVEFASWDSQGYLGYGNNTGSRLVTGRTVGAAYHTLKRTGNSNQYRWIENPCTNMLTWVDGWMNNGYYPCLGLDNATFADSTSGLTTTGLYVNINTNPAYIYRFKICDAFPWAFIPTRSGGAYNTYVRDYVYMGSGCFPAVGGYYDSNTDTTNGYYRYGLFYIYNGYGSTSTSTSVGTRLIYIP